MVADTLIEADKPLSRSLLWEIQRRYFLQAGMTAWGQDIVPHAISCSPAMARSYAQLILAYLEDCASAASSGAFRFNRDDPLYIIELGAGSGRLTYHLLHQLLPLLDYTPFNDLPLTCVLTDFNPTLLDAWATDPYLQPWIAAGKLDYALFDATTPAPLQLQHAGRILNAERLSNPLVLLANYFFDSIPQDSFVLSDGTLNSNLLSLLSSQPEPDLNDPTLWERLHLAFEAIPLSAEPYAHPHYNALLGWYTELLPDTTLSFPNVGLDCLNFWQTQSDFLLLTADRGHTLPEGLVGQADPELNLHGSFSLMVNYHAIATYIEATGGRALTTPHYQDEIQVLACLLGAVPNGGKRCELAYQTAVVEQGPNELFPLRSLLESQLAQLTLPHLLSLLRLSAYDGELFALCAPRLEELIAAADPVWHADVAAVVTAVAQQYLPLQENDALLSIFDEMLKELSTPASA